MPDYKAAYDSMAHVLKGIHRPEPSEVALIAVECVAKVMENSPLEVLVKSIDALRKLTRAGSIAYVPNPWFVFNRIGEGTASVATEAFLKRECLTAAATAGFQGVGIAAHGATGGVDVAGVAVHGSAVGTSGAHAAKLLAISREGRYRDSKTIQDWLAFVIKMKAMRAALHVAAGTTALIPFASLPGKLATAVVGLGIKMTLTSACYHTAAAIHWRAYQEAVLTRHLGGNSAPAGPAGRIFWEVFTRRGFTRVFGQDRIGELILEPAGWRALGAKLIQM